jgi:hypothetical protein
MTKVTASDSSPFERLQSTIMAFHNRKVNISFSDINDSTPPNQRKLLKSDLLIKDKDNGIIMILKMLLFFVYIEDDKVYGIPIEEYQRTVVFRPQIMLKFIESRAAAKAAKRQRVAMELSFRLMDKESTNITQANITEYIREIKASFPSTYSFDKGKIKFSYKDIGEGFNFVISGQTETDVKELITKTLKIIDKIPDWDYLTKSEYTDKNLSAAKYKTILGKRTKIPQYRPLAKVYLRKAELKIHGNIEDIILLDRFVS